LKLERSPVAAPRFDRILGPTCACEHATARLQFRLRKASRIDATIVNSSGGEIRNLATDVQRPVGRVAFTWDGRDEEGEVVPDGRYRLRVHLRDDGRTITVPTPIRVDSTPPRIRLVSAHPPVISPDNDGYGDRVQYIYRVDEFAVPWVVVDGADVRRGRLRPAGRGRVRWRGILEDGPASPGTYMTWVVAEDLAGNRSEPTRTVPARVRYVELARVPRRVRASRLFSFFVDADPKTVALWFETRRGGGRVTAQIRRRPGRIVVRAPRRTGLYALVVSTGRHTDQAVLRVTRG
jgi:FlgD Ig-like domain